MKDIIESLKQFGYAIQPDVIDVAICDKLAAKLDQMSESNRTIKIHESSEQKTILNVHIYEPDLFLDYINIPKVMAVVQEVLKDTFTLSNFNASHSGKDGGSRIHIDSRVPMNKFENTFQMVAMLCLDDFTSLNGATRVSPMSHLSGANPRDFTGNQEEVIKGMISAEAKKGSVVYILGQTWHDVGPNKDGSRRWGIIAYYSVWWIKPTFDFTKSDPAILKRLNTEQKILFGLNTMPPDPYENRFYTKTTI